MVDDHVTDRRGMSVPRIAEARPPAEPTSPDQVERRQRMLRAAARLGAEHGLERVQMNEIAKQAGVAIATLYRYFPSKTHLFAAVMHTLVERLGEENSAPRPAGDTGGAVAAVSGLLVGASRQLLERPLLAMAMLQSNNVVHIEGGETEARTTDEVFRNLMLRTAGIDDPTERDRRLVWLLEQTWYGGLMALLYGRTTQDEAEADIRLSTELLLATRSTA